MKDQNEFQTLWNDYLEGEITSDGMIELQTHFAGDEQLLKNSVDSFQIHRLLGYDAQADEQHDAFVKSTMSQLLTRQDQARVATDSLSAPDTAQSGQFPRSLTNRFLITAIALAASILIALSYNTNSQNGRSSIIARTINVHGAIEWTHENGVVEIITENNKPLTGGTLETMTGESTVTMQFLSLIHI